MRRFHLERDRDITGTSGTGHVADGVMFGDGTTVLHWCVPDMPTSTTVYTSVVELVRIHAHDGATRLIWMDDPPAVGAPEN